MAPSSKHLENVKTTFDAMDDYDRTIARIIPDYDRMLDATLRIARHLVKPKQMLELGVGTGLVAETFLRAYPKTRLTAIDFAPKMIERATKRLARFKKRVELLEGDFYELAFPSCQDLVVSSLAIHHLSDVQKATLFEKIHECLVDDGVFINADCLAATTDRLERLQGLCWLGAMESGGMSSEEIESVIGDHNANDIPATVDDQLGWIDRAGFAEAECLWRTFAFGIIVAIK